MKMIRMTAGVAAGVTICVISAGCGSHGASQPAAVPSISSAASALATSAAGQDVRGLIKKCVPASALAQLQLGHQLLADTSQHPDGAWANLLRCTGVTPGNESAIEAAALTAAEKVNWLSVPARHQYFDATLPNIITSFAAVPGISASPTGTAS